MPSQKPDSAKRSAWARYGVAVGCVVLGWLAREAITPIVGPTALPFIFCFPSVAIAAWYGGLGPGVLAIILSAVGANWFFVEPVNGWAVYAVGDLATMVAFAIACSFIVGAVEAMHRARAHALADTRKRQAAELEIRQQKELLATTLASIGDAVIATDTEGRVVLINAQAEVLTGWKSLEATTRPLSEVFRIINEKTREPVENPVEKALRFGVATAMANHTLLIAKDGREIPIDDSAAPIRHSGGPILGIVLVFRDFTERKLAEKALREAHEQLADRAGQLETLVQERTAKLQDVVNELQHVSHAMAHDMRAPLRAMSMFASLLAEKASAGVAPAEAQDYTRRIIVAAERLDKLIQDALHYTKVAQQEVSLDPVDLSELLRDLVDTYPNFHPDKADIRIADGLPVVLGNDSLLTQCFSNLLGNAVKFMATGVKPEVRVRAEVSDGTARIWIKDNGIGIPKESQARLFQMFQKLDSEYEGTGIGLAIVRKVVERMGGKVGAESEPGAGSKFWVELPLADGRNRERVATT